MSRSMLVVAALLASACDKEPTPAAPPAASGAAPLSAATQDEAPTASVADAEPAPAACSVDTSTSAAVGAAAPVFTLTDVDGKAHCLSDYRGKVVVLEWFNPKCPFVNFAHTRGPLKDQAAKETANGVVWLAINSGGPGRQGHGERATRQGMERYGMAHPVLLDEDGAIGHQYGAVKTPHIYLIDTEGTLVYRGAIDNAPFGEVTGGSEYVNHLSAALNNLRAGAPIATPETAAYGCTVKYAR